MSGMGGVRLLADEDEEPKPGDMVLDCGHGWIGGRKLFRLRPSVPGAPLEASSLSCLVRAPGSPQPVYVRWIVLCRWCRLWTWIGLCGRVSRARRLWSWGSWLED